MEKLLTEIVVMNNGRVTSGTQGDMNTIALIVMGLLLKNVDIMLMDAITIKVVLMDLDMNVICVKMVWGIVVFVMVIIIIWCMIDVYKRLNTK